MNLNAHEIEVLSATLEAAEKELEAKDKLIDELMLGFVEIRDNLVDGDIESICDYALDLTEKESE